MTHPLTRRLRDPVHGLIRFDGDDPVDCLAWRLINTSAFQRLRRVKQLGFSEFVFPGATHTRFAHCVGVFHTARKLRKIVEREIEGNTDDYRATVSVLAALLHDVGHGPFSHTFEEVQKARGVKKNHERWSAEIILSPEADIRTILDGSAYGPKLAADIAALLVSETPSDIYHALVSSSFDADRLDYLLRDRMMTGSKAGAIDFDWLMDNVRVANLDLGADDDSGDGPVIPTFALARKGIQAAESFLLARYHLYEQVYLHKTTRGLEHLLSAFLKVVSELVSKGRWEQVGLEERHALVQFLASKDPTTSEYLALDDFTVWGAIELASKSASSAVKELANRILERQLLRCLDVEAECLAYSLDRLPAYRKLRNHVKDRLGKTVFKDDPKLSIYGTVGADDIKLHKRITVDLGDGNYREIVEASPVVSALREPKPLLRYYFISENERQSAIDLIRAR